MIKNRLKIFPTSFLSLFHLRCCSQGTSISYVHFRSLCFQQILHNSLFQIDTRKIHVRTVVPKLQSLILGPTRRVVLPKHCIVANVPSSQQNHKLIWITVFLRSTAPQNLISPSSVNFVIKKFQPFMLYGNTKTLNTECRSDQEQEMRMWRT